MEALIKKFKPQKIRRSRVKRVAFAVVFAIFVLYTITVMFPMVWSVISSLKTDDEYYARVFALPQHWLFSNYVMAFKEFRVGNTTMIAMIGNSLWLACTFTFVGVMVSSASAYIVAKYPFWGSKIIYSVAVFIQIIPIFGSMPAAYKLITGLGLNNPIGIVVTATGGFGFNFIILTGFYRSVSWTYAEAAFMDGASHLKVYLKIMLPQALPAITAIAIMGFIGTWNDYMTPLLYLRDYPTLALGIYQFDIIQQHQSNMPAYYCALVISMLPILLIFCFFQNIIMENTVAGGLKG